MRRSKSYEICQELMEIASDWLRRIFGQKLLKLWRIKYLESKKFKYYTFWLKIEFGNLPTKILLSERSLEKVKFRMECQIELSSVVWYRIQTLVGSGQRQSVTDGFLIRLELVSFNHQKLFQINRWNLSRRNLVEAGEEMGKTHRFPVMKFCSQ